MLVVVVIALIYVVKSVSIESEKEKFINNSVSLNNISTDSKLTSALKILKDISLSLEGKDKSNLNRAMNVKINF